MVGDVLRSFERALFLQVLGQLRRTGGMNWTIKITTVPKAKIGTRVGLLADEDMVRLNRAVLVFLGIAAPQQGATGIGIRS